MPSTVTHSSSPLQHWLIGPIAHDNIDLRLKNAFPNACFFDAHRPLATQYKCTDFKGILCIEPFQRLMPGDVWEIELPRVALAKSPPSGFSLALGENLWEPTLRCLNAWIPLDSVFSPEEAAFLRRHDVDTTAQVWTFEAHHLTRGSAPVLFKHAWINPYAWQVTSAAAHHSLREACPELYYFLNGQTADVQRYFSKIEHIICAAAFQHPYLLQALAAGAQLWIPEQHKGSIPASLVNAIHTYENLQTFAEALSHLPAMAPPPTDLVAVLAPFTLNHALPERLDAFQNSSPRPAGDLLPAVSEATRLLHARGANILDRLVHLLKQPEVRNYAWQPLAECSVYLRFLLGDFIQDPQQKEHLYRQVLGLSQRVGQKTVQILCQYFVYKLRLNYQTASEALSQLIESTQTGPVEHQIETQQTLHYFLHLLQENIFLEITFTPESDLKKSVHAWLNFQQAYLLAYTERQAEAASLLAATRTLATPPTLSSLWCALGNYRASLSEAEGWKQAYPLHIWVGLKYIEALHRSQTSSQAIIAQEIQRLKVLCQSLNGESQELEKVLAYERVYCPRPPIDTRVIHWEGPLYSYSSLAQTNTYWLQALIEDSDYTPLNIPFEPIEQQKPVIDLELPPLVAQTPTFFISQRWPFRRHAPEAGVWVSMMPWAFGAAPQLWVEQINAPEMHAVWVPSAYVAHSFWRSGVHEEKITVMPRGVDTHRFCPTGVTYALATQKKFCFLFVGDPLPRKGVDILIRAYTAAFSATDDVCLVIKTREGKHDSTFTDFMPEKSPSRLPEIEHIAQELSPEDLAALYRRCQVYVHPYRGESFATAILEAMASGTPAIVPDAGPAPEFCSEAAGWYVPTRIASDGALNISNQGIASVHAYFTTVDEAALAEQMRAVYHTEDWKEKGLQAVQEAINYDWQRLYPRLKKQLQAPQTAKALSHLQPLPSRLYLHNPWGLLPLENTPEVQFVSDRALAEQSLFYCLNPNDVQSLLESLPQLSGSIAVCGTSDLRDALIKGGWPSSHACVHALMIDTQRFDPEVPAFKLEASDTRFSFLLCFDWQTPGHWQDILRAYSTAFHSSDPVHLIFKPYNVDFEACIESFMTWFESTGIEEDQLPDITFMEEALVPEALPAFLSGVNCFIDNHSEPLALAAIASEVAVITGSTLPCLQRPAAERYRLITSLDKSQQVHQASLIYLLKGLVARPNPMQRRHARQDLQTRQNTSDWQKAFLNTLQQTLRLT